MKKKIINPKFKDLDKKVSAGVAFLDVVRPGWYKEINTKELDLAESNVCMLGEIYGSYLDGKSELGLQSTSAESLGFYIDAASGKGMYDYLTKSWKQRIAKIRKKFKKTK